MTVHKKKGYGGTFSTKVPASASKTFSVTVPKVAKRSVQID